MNTKSLLPTIIVGLVAGAIGAAAGLWAHDDAPPARTASDDSDRFDRLDTEIANLRVALRNAARSPAARNATEPDSVQAADASDTESTKAETVADDLPEFERLRKKVLGWNATAEENARFWELARTSNALPQLIERLKAAVKNEPDKVAARLQLARAYVAKLYTVPNGPERGVWAVQAEGEWREVLKREDSNWQARYSLAFSLSQWPAFFNKTPAAIKEFETLMTQQETGRPEPHQAQIYAQLAQLYRSRGQADKATAALKRGLERHPDDEALKSALDG